MEVISCVHTTMSYSRACFSQLQLLEAFFLASPPRPRTLLLNLYRVKLLKLWNSIIFIFTHAPSAKFCVLRPGNVLIRCLNLCVGGVCGGVGEATRVRSGARPSSLVVRVVNLQPEEGGTCLPSSTGQSGGSVKKGGGGCVRVVVGEWGG